MNDFHSLYTCPYHNPTSVNISYPLIAHLPNSTHIFEWWALCQMLTQSYLWRSFLSREKWHRLKQWRCLLLTPMMIIKIINLCDSVGVVVIVLVIVSCASKSRRQMVTRVTSNPRWPRPSNHPSYTIRVYGNNHSNNIND